MVYTVEGPLSVIACVVTCVTYNELQRYVTRVDAPEMVAKSVRKWNQLQSSGSYSVVDKSPLFIDAALDVVTACSWTSLGSLFGVKIVAGPGVVIVVPGIRVLVLVL